jgi:uncharacterized protein
VTRSRRAGSVWRSVGHGAALALLAAIALFAMSAGAARLETGRGDAGVPDSRDSSGPASDVPAPEAAPPAWTPSVPPLSGPVVDTAGVLSPAEERAIVTLVTELERKTTAEIAVLTVGSTAPLDPFDYGLRVAESWKLGKQGRDNGLLLLVAVGDRKVRFFAGYGLEGILPDGKLGAILDDYVTPHFRAGDYGGGIQAGVRAAAQEIADDAGVTLEGEPLRAPRTPAPQVDLVWLLLFLFLFVLPLVLASRSRGRRRRWFFPIFFGGGRFGGGFDGGGFGGGFGDGFGGGGGGFGGGGRFGGGGAGRGW